MDMKKKISSKENDISSEESLFMLVLVELLQNILIENEQYVTLNIKQNLKTAIRCTKNITKNFDNASLLGYIDQYCDEIIDLYNKIYIDCLKRA